MDRSPEQAARLADVERLQLCEQCGCCSSACPLTGVDGFNIRRMIRHVELDLAADIATTPYPWACTTCGRCESVCPNGIGILDLVRLLRGIAPAELVPDGPPPCVAACPAGIDIPGYVRLIAAGQPAEAYALILRQVPFVGILGRVCTHPCEGQCRRGEVNQPVAACALKRYAADNKGEFSLADLPRADDSGHRVAVIGAGPAGLTAALNLRRKGHRVTVFEARSKPGGMLRYGIPRYRLPEALLDEEIDQILSLGIELEAGKQLGRDFGLEQLGRDGFEAVFLAIGLPDSRKIALPGAEADGVMPGVEFLAAVSEGRAVDLKDRVVVIGGGNVAVDVALTALRRGATQVTMACLESRDEMPASPWEIATAIDEGVELLPSWGPERIAVENGNVTGIELIECIAVFDAEGRFNPTFGDVRTALAADQVILAIGQTVDLAHLAGDGGCRVERGLIAVDRATGATDRPGVFAGGDVASGPGSIIAAIAAGKRAAGAIDAFLGGDGLIDAYMGVGGLIDGASDADGLIDGTLTGGQPPPYDGRREKGFAYRIRSEMDVLPLADRHTGFAELELGFTADQAVHEARRCLQCDLERALALRAARR